MPDPAADAPPPPSVLRERWREEMESAWLYRALRRAEPDVGRQTLFASLADAATAQAGLLASDLRALGRAVPAYRPSARARLVATLARRLGVRALRPVLSAMKVRGMSVYNAPPHDAAAGHPMPTSVAQIGGRHHGTGGGLLRAAVFGANDGLVSNACLILGVAGATSDRAAILTTGVAGLLAGAFSMAAGEYISVRSQREMFERQIGEERAELARYPAEEAEELALIYEARGLPLAQAREVAHAMVRDPARALTTLAREELGLNPEDLGSPWGAALSSFAAFASGAVLPLLPFVLRVGGAHPVLAAAALSAAALFAIGAALSLFSGRSAWAGGLRMLLIGAMAGAATFGIGRLLHVSVG